MPISKWATMWYCILNNLLPRKAVFALPCFKNPCFFYEKCYLFFVRFYAII